MHQFEENSEFQHQYEQSASPYEVEYQYTDRKVLPVVLNDENYQPQYDAEYPASPNFYRGPPHSQYNIKEERSSGPSYSNKLMTEIKPRLDDILANQTFTNKEVEKGLQELRNLQQRLEMDISNSQEQSYKQIQNKGGYLSEINRIIDQIILNSQKESLQFKASLQDLKNVNTSMLNDDYEQPQYQQGNGTNKNSESADGNISNFLDNLSNIESRLFNEIISLRQQKVDIINQLNMERERYHELQRKHINLQKNYNQLVDEIRKGERDSRDHFSHRQNRHFNETSRSRLNQKSSREHSDDIRHQINQMQHRLRNASKQKIRLQKEIDYFKQSSTPNQQNLVDEIKVLDAELAVSQRKAAVLFPYKTNNDRLKIQLQKIRHQNDQLRRQSGFRSQSPGLQNYKSHTQRNRQDYQATTRRQEYYRSGSRSPQHSNVQQGQSLGDKIDQYKQFLNTIRNMNR